MLKTDEELDAMMARQRARLGNRQEPKPTPPAPPPPRANPSVPSVAELQILAEDIFTLIDHGHQAVQLRREAALLAAQAAAILAEVLRRQEKAGLSEEIA